MGGVLCANGSGQCPECLNCGGHAALHALADVDGAGADHHMPQAFRKHCVGEQRRGGGAVANCIVGPDCGISQQLSSQIFHGILELQLLGNGDAVITDHRSAILLFDEHRSYLGPERAAYGIGERGCPLQQFRTSGVVKEQICINGHIVIMEPNRVRRAGSLCQISRDQRKDFRPLYGRMSFVRTTLDSGCATTRQVRRRRVWWVSAGSVRVPRRAR